MPVLVDHLDTFDCQVCSSHQRLIGRSILRSGRRALELSGACRRQLPSVHLDLFG